MKKLMFFLIILSIFSCRKQEQPAPPVYIISGTILDCDTQDPITDCTISVYKCTHDGNLFGWGNPYDCDVIVKKAQTNAIGEYEISLNEKGTYRIITEAEGFWDITYPKINDQIKIEKDFDIHLDFKLIPESWIKFTLASQSTGDSGNFVLDTNEDCNNPYEGLSSIYIASTIDIGKVIKGFGNRNIAFRWDCDIIGMGENCLKDTVFLPRGDTVHYEIIN